MKKIIYLSCFLVFSCSAETDIIEDKLTPNSIKHEKKIMYFSNWNEFYETYAAISSVDIEELKLWAKEKNPSSLLLHKPNITSPEYQEISNDNYYLTNGLQAILNQDKLFQVENEIIHYNDQNFYVIQKANLSNETNWSKDLNTENIIGSISIEKIPVESVDKTTIENYRTVLNASDHDRNYYQKEFKRRAYIPCAGGKNQGGSKYTFKYVHEIVARKFNVGYPNIITELYLDLKLEYRYRRGWKNAGEDRNITVDVNGTVESTSNNPKEKYNSISIKRDFHCVNSNQRIFLASAQYASNIGSEPDWIIDIQGTISQHVNKDSDLNKYTHYAQW